jgi:hypothetical protein
MRGLNHGLVRCLAVLLPIVTLAACSTQNTEQKFIADPVPDPQAVSASDPSDPLDCASYPEPRIFLESQAWWTRTPGKSGTNFGHVHVGTCFPYKQTISGVVRFDLRVILHDNPGKAYLLRLGTEDRLLYQSDIDFSCPSPGTCTKWYTVLVDTRGASHDGRNEFRITVKVREPDGNVMFNSSGWQAYLENGKSSSDYRSSDQTEARGWYTGVGYANARFTSDLPLVPVSGDWNFEVGLRPGSGGIPVTYHSVLLDPDFHHGNPGISIKEGSGSYVGAISIDTRKLANGKHKLLLRTNADAETGSTNSGILVIPFTVAN